MTEERERKEGLDEVDAEVLEYGQYSCLTLSVHLLSSFTNLH